jgi:tetratricopeptide (TPR) repeat protein
VSRSRFRLHARRYSTQAYVLSLRATRLDPDNAEALAIYGHLCSFLTRDFNTALHCFERALRLNPNLGLAWTLRAATHCYVGEPEAALACLDRYRELAPFDPYFGFFETIYANAYTLSGAYEEAVQVGRRAVRANPDFVNGYKALLAALGHLGRTDEAAHYRALLASREPDFSIERFVETYPFQRDVDRQRYAEGLRLAGVPESEAAPARTPFGLKPGRR